MAEGLVGVAKGEGHLLILRGVCEAAACRVFCRSQIGAACQQVDCTVARLDMPLCIRASLRSKKARNIRRKKNMFVIEVVVADILA